jgi:tetratricopeptide (TPR) repeat protein
MMNDEPKDRTATTSPPPAEDGVKAVPGSSTLRVLLYDLWFRIAAVLGLLVFVLLVLFLPKIWTSTPPDFLPVVKVSGLDKVQAGALRRSAERFRAEKKFPEAILAWQSASQNDPGNPELARGALRTLIEQPLPTRANLGFGVDRTFWLLRLTRTNAADLSLAVRFLHHADLDNLVGQLIENRAGELGPEALPDVLVVYFRLNQMDHFNDLWQRHLQEFTNSPVLRLYQTAWRAAWGPPLTLRPARAELEAAQNDANTDIARLAHQLQLMVSVALGELARYESSLNWLEEHHFDRVIDHINHWHMLVVSGQRSRAQELARSFSQPPEGASDAAGMAAIYETLGLGDYAVEFLEKQIQEFPYYGQLWIQLAQMHINQKRWDEVRNAAVSIRNTTQLRGQLDGYSQYLSGLADLKQGRIEAAAAAFDKVPSQLFPEPLVAYSVARELLHLGYGEVSSKMLQKLEADYGNKAAFWFDLTVAAYEARQMDVLETAARKAWEIEPQRIDIINNYAAALIVLRKQPEEAVKLTLSLVTSQPKRLEFKVNHALALLQNGRLAEAEDILKALNPTQLSVNDSAVVDYAWFELAIRRGDLAGARKIYPTIKRSELLPPQLVWLDAEYKKIAEVPAP